MIKHSPVFVTGCQSKQSTGLHWVNSLLEPSLTVLLLATCGCKTDKEPVCHRQILYSSPVYSPWLQHLILHGIKEWSASCTTRHIRTRRRRYVDWRWHHTDRWWNVHRLPGRRRWCHHWHWYRHSTGRWCISEQLVWSIGMWEWILCCQQTFCTTYQHSTCTIFYSYSSTQISALTIAIISALLTRT